MITTLHLQLQPLTYRQIILYLAKSVELTRQLQCEPCTWTVAPELIQSMDDVIFPFITMPGERASFEGFWVIMQQPNGPIIGDFTLIPDAYNDDEYEIGYRIEEPFRNRGFMQEAMHGLIDWAKGQGLIRTLKARTNINNLPSQQVLHHCGFAKGMESEDSSEFLYLRNLF